MAQIKTYARLKPSKRAYPGYEIANNVLTVHIPDNKDFLLQGSQQPIRSNISYDIIFTDIFRPEATQEEVFSGVAKDIIQNFLNGYNGTIFAYGQTGTGKTYTVEGNSSGYHTRGLATRALSMIYQQLEKRTDEHISVYLSYLEIYQEVAYDLLNPASRSSSIPMPPFAKSIKEVTVVEGPRGSCILRGLSLHLAANEEIAQMLLYQGQVNRKVAETPVNQRSSRSHAVFTVYLQVRKHESEVLVNSKLHLVDLAGSERVSKTGVDGQQLTEAKSINLSLHHLETVIIALQSDRTNTPSNTTAAGEKSKGDNLPTASRSTSFTSGPSSESNRPVKFVPYRNSLLTMVLKDSLGGNCLTAMIATISLEPENLGESISTCRFAQRVARIANNARRNEEIDDKTLIKRLKHKVADLEHQVALLRSKGKSEPISEVDLLGVLTEEDRIVCARIMEGFLQGVITDPVDAGICDQCRFRECLHFLKHQCLQPGNVPWVMPQQDREAASDRTEAVLPNNPHRDSGDHVMNTTSQGTSPIVTLPNTLFPASTSLKLCADSAQQSSSEATIYSSDDYLLGNMDIDQDQAEGGIDVNKSGGGSQISLRKKGDMQASFCSSSKKGSGVKKSSKKARKIEGDKLSKYEQMDKIKLDALINELTISENNLSFKLHVTDEQVLDQHAYLSQLRQLQAEPELVAKEQLVEKHLLKRQAKFREKLGQVILQKSRLGRLLNQDMASPAVSMPQRVPADELKPGKGSLNSKQVFDLLRVEEKSLKECAEGDKAVYESKGKLCAASKEPTNTEKYQEMKNIFKMSQKPKETAVDAPLVVCPKEIDKMESNQSSLYHPTRQSFDAKMDAFPCSYSPVAEDRNGSRSKDGVMSSVSEVDATDMDVKRLQEYLDQVLNVAFIDKFASDARQCDGVSSLSRTHERVGQPQANPLYHGVGGKAANKDSLSPGFDGVMPTEVKSMHDPRHSHKFAMDDRPYESSSLVTPEKNNIETLYSGWNINNSTVSRSLSGRGSKSADRKLPGRSRDTAGRNQNNSNNWAPPGKTAPWHLFTSPSSIFCNWCSWKHCSCSLKTLQFLQDALEEPECSSAPVSFIKLKKRFVKTVTEELPPCSILPELVSESCRGETSVVARSNRTRNKCVKFPQRLPLPCKQVDKYGAMVLVMSQETLKPAPLRVSRDGNVGMLSSREDVSERHTGLRKPSTDCGADILSLQQEETSFKSAGTKNHDMSLFLDARKKLFQLGKSKCEDSFELLPRISSYFRLLPDKDTCSMNEKMEYNHSYGLFHDDSDLGNPLKTVRAEDPEDTEKPESTSGESRQVSLRSKRKHSSRWALREPGC